MIQKWGVTWGVGNGNGWEGGRSLGRGEGRRWKEGFSFSGDLRFSPLMPALSVFVDGVGASRLIYLPLCIPPLLSPSPYSHHPPAPPAPPNGRTQDIDPEMVEVHRFVVDRYSQKFPELDSLIPQPADYIRTVQVMKNEMVSMGEGGERGQGREVREERVNHVREVGKSRGSQEQEQKIG